MSAVRMDCLGRGSNVMTPSEPVLLPPSPPPPLPLGCALLLVEASLFVVVLPLDDSLAESSGAESVSEGDPGESHPWMGLGGMGEGSPQR